jgi:hypothetical protein
LDCSVAIFRILLGVVKRVDKGRRRELGGCLGG